MRNKTPKASYILYIIGSRERDGEMERVETYRRTAVSNNNIVVVCYCFYIVTLVIRL